jgi:lipopolysaccharide export system protein LptA
MLILLDLSNSFAQNTKKIEIINAEVLEYDKSQSIKAYRLIGKVVLKHEGSYMYADSAYNYTERNAFDAFGHIHIEQGDTLHLYGDILNYDGETKLANIKGNVRLLDKEVNIETDRLIYDLANKTAFYTDSAVTYSSEGRILKSRKGYYYSEKKEFAFKTNVVIEDPQYTIFSDTLLFNTVSEISNFYGPTTIVSKENTIYCERGWYDTKNDISEFRKNAKMVSKSQTISGDRLYYDRNRGYGKGLGNVEIVDTLENIIVRGNFAETFREIQRYLVTDRMVFIQIMDQDSLFLHADTLLATQIEGDKRLIRTFHGVRFYKTDMQGKCDSLTYNTSDSLMSMFYAPVIWSEENQLTADSISITVKNGRAEKLQMRNSSFIVSEEDTTRYNQIKGKNMDGYFRDNKLYRIDVFSNGQTIYYPKDDSNEIIGANKADCTDMKIYIEDSKVNRILFINHPEGTLYPDHKIIASEMILRGFQWFIDIRPKDKNDIFKRPEIVIEAKSE